MGDKSVARIKSVHVLWLTRLPLNIPSIYHPCLHQYLIRRSIKFRIRRLVRRVNKRPTTRCNNLPSKFSITHVLTDLQMESPQAPSSRHKPIRVAEAWKKLVAAGKVLKLLGSLSDGEAARVTEAVEILQTAQISQRRRKYKLLLHSIHGLLGPQGVLLCAVALGQVKAVDMKSSDRTGLITRIETNKTSVDINHPSFQALAVTHEIPNSINGTFSIFLLQSQSLISYRCNTTAK